MSEERPAPSPVNYRFGPFHVDGRLRRLFRDGQPVPLTTKAVDTLVALLERAGRVVEKDELLRAVWGEVVVGEETLAQNISTLRRVLEDDPTRPLFIATVPRRGYKFVARLGTAAPGPAAGGGEQPLAPPSPGLPGWRFAGLTGALSLAVVAGALATPWLSARNPPRPAVEFTIDEPESGKFFAGGNVLAVSPDGEYVTFVANDSQGIRSIWLRPLNSPTARRLDDTEGASQMFWSADSRALGFFADQRLKAVDIASGAVRTVAALASGRTLGGTWSRAGQILFSVPAEGMYVVSASGGSPERLPLDTACVDCASWPHFLPDGRRFLYTVAGSDPSTRGIYVGELDQARGRRLLDVVSSATFIPPGFVSYASAGTLYVQSVDPVSLELAGAPRPLADGVALNVRTGRTVAATSANGVLAFRRPLVTELVWVDRAGTPIGAATPPGTYLSFSIAPDGEHVAVARLDPRTGTSDIWVYGPGRAVPMTDDAAWDANPVWSHDGRHVTYSSRRDGQWRIYRRPATAVGPEELLVDADTLLEPLQILRSGQLVYTAPRSSSHAIWKLGPDGPIPLANGGDPFSSNARLSPDEQWLARGVETLSISGFPFGAGGRPIAEGASMPRWRRDGRELFYLSREFTIVSVPVDPPRTPGESPGRALFRASELTLTGINGQVYDAAPDGQRFLLKREVRSSPIHVVLNWEARLTPK